MSSIIKGQLNTRKHFARSLLSLELQMSKHYEKELNNRTVKMTDDEREYKKRVVAAVDKVRHYAGNFPNAETRIKYIDMLIDGYSNIQAVCTEVNISESTYFEWKKSIMRVFGSAMGIYV